MEGQSRRGSLSQHPESRGGREQESGRFPYGRLSRGRSHNREDDGSSPPPYRHYERGHPLPSNRSPERKDCIPFRNRHLGLPSLLRRSEALSEEALSGLSPERYMPHSNFRRGDSQSRGSPRSLSPRSSHVSPYRPVAESPSSSHRRSSTSRDHVTSHVSSHQPSRRCSPSRRRSSVVSHTASPTRGSASHQKTDAHSPSQNSNGHSLDSEKLYKNLKSIASSGESADSEQDLRTWSKKSNSTTEMDSYYHGNGHNGQRNIGHNSRNSGHNTGYNSGRNTGRNSRDPSPHRRGYDTSSQFSRKGNGHNGHNSGHNTGRNTGRNSRDPSPHRRGYDTSSHFSKKDNGHNGRNSAHNTGRNTGRNSRDSSPHRRGYDNSSQLSPRANTNNDPRSDTGGKYSKTTTSDRHSRTDPSQSRDSWRGSTNGLLSPASPALSRSTSPPRRSPNCQLLNDSPRAHAVTTETDKRNTDRSRSSIRRGLEAIITSSSEQKRSLSTEMTIEDYVVIADIPRPNLYLQEEEGPVLRKRPQSRSPRRDHQHRAAGHSEGRGGYSEYGDTEERGRGRERGRDRRERERRCQDQEVEMETHDTTLRPAQKSSSLPGEEHRTLNGQERHPPDQTHMQPDLLNFKKGWMSRVDENGEWRKHWFVLTNAGLWYYRDSLAEERDEPDGEVELRTCVNVIEFDVGKNYGLQIHTRQAVVTLSAMTSRIRRNWIDVLRKRVQSSSSSDIMQLPDSSGSDKENSVSHHAPSRLSPSHFSHHDSGSEVTGPSSPRPDPDDTDLVTPLLTNQREAGEGRDREHERRLEDRTKWFQDGLPEEGVSRWDTVELKKGMVAPVAQKRTARPRAQMGTDVEKRWTDFERLPLGEMRSLSLIDSPVQQPTNEALQREVFSLRQQIEDLRRGRTGAGAGGPCGPDAPCGPRLEALERAHQQALEQLQAKHEGEQREVERERDRLLQEEAQATAQDVEVLRRAHREQLEREVERVRRPGGGAGGDSTDPPHRDQPSESDSLQRELDSLSERYSQKCVELKRTQHSSGERHSDIGQREREMEQLRKENQELQSRLAEEISLMRAFITGQRSEVVSLGNYERSTSELEMLLRAKDNEIQYLQKEISCLRNGVHSINKEKQTASERYKDVYVELSGVKGRSERELSTLSEHLRLTNAALQEEQRLGN